MTELAFRRDTRSRSVDAAPEPSVVADDFAWRRRLLTALIAATAIAPLAFVPRDEPTVALDLVKLAAKAGSLSGTVLLVWQVALGARHLVARLLPDLPWLIGAHKQIGRFGLALVALHPIFITLYYTRTGRGAPLVTDVVPRGPVALGLVAFALMLVIVATSLAVKRIGFRPWFKVHALAYLVLPLVFLHAMPIGTTVLTTPFGTAFRVLAAVTGVLYAVRLVSRWRARSFEVVGVERVGPETVEITLRPLGHVISPRTGQFVYLRGRSLGRGHPYSVSRFDANSGELSITARAMGPFSEALQAITTEHVLKVDGPYGVFTQDALAVDLPVVVIAGGIGITPFMRLIRTREPRGGRRDWLFFANPSAEGIVYRDELEEHSSFGIVHVLEDASGARDSRASIEEGRISIDLIERYAGTDLERHMFFLCGPPPLVEAVARGLDERGVPKERVRIESFDV